MSMTTENSLQRDSNVSWCRRFYNSICCPCFKRKVAPINPLPNDSDFMKFGKKGKRIICVVHIDPSLSNGIFPSSDKSLATFAKKLVCDENGYESDSSNDDYWFSKWSRPLRTVKRFQTEHLKKQTIIGMIRNHLPPADKSKQESPNCDTNKDQKVVTTLAKEQSSQIIQDASQEGSNQLSPTTCESTPTDGKDGVINLGFEDSPSDPGTTINTAAEFKHQNTIKPLLYFIHGAGESSESWRVLMHHFAGLGYEVLGLDLLGHGFSHTPLEEKSYTFKKLLGDVLNVFDAHISNGRKCVIIGHGYGYEFE